MSKTMEECNVWNAQNRKIKNLEAQINLMFPLFEHEGDIDKPFARFCSDREDCTKCQVNELIIESRGE